MVHRLASIDLGSNTFRLSIAQVDTSAARPELLVQDRKRELIAMANGLDENLCVNSATIADALAALSRFGALLDGLPASQVRAVATNTFRVARNAPAILAAGELALGYPIEVISGAEEARLIYLGVAHSVPAGPQQRLVMDIGGGSTEFIIGAQTTPLELASLDLGCTTLTRRYFPDGRVSAPRMEQAVAQARSTIDAIAARYKARGWQKAYGSSGSAKGLFAVLKENQLCAAPICLEGLYALRDALVRAGEVRLQDWAGLKAERAPVLVGGLAIMIAAFEQLQIDQMDVGDGALRLGVLYDLLAVTKL